MSNLLNYKDGRQKRNGRLFYEIWGDLEAQNTSLKIVIILMSLITVIALLTAFWTYKANRVPVVIRVNKAGNAKVLRNLPFNNKTGSGYFSLDRFHFLMSFAAYAVK